MTEMATAVMNTLGRPRCPPTRQPGPVCGETNYRRHRHRLRSGRVCGGGSQFGETVTVVMAVIVCLGFGDGHISCLD